jgi:hypothetical protein
MDWLKEHAYIAPWLTPFVAITIAVIQNRKHLLDFNWRSFTVYVTFFTLTAVTISPSFSDATKSRVTMIWIMAFLFIIWDYFPPRKS